MTRRRGIAFAAVGVSALVLIGGAVAAAIQHQLTPDDYLLFAAVAWTFTAIGGVIAFRQPHQRMGWLMLAVGGLWGLSIAGPAYATIDGVPLRSLAAVAAAFWEPALVLLAVAVVVFPDGDPPSRIWRWPLRALGALSAVWAVSMVVALAGPVFDGTIRFASDGNVEQLEHKTTLAAHANGIATGLSLVTVAATIICWLFSQFVSYRRLRGERRAQQKWILTGVATSFTTIALAIALGASSTLSLFLLLGMVTMPVAMGVAVLRYRLYEIDRIISRTLAYAIVTALLAGMFVGLVVLTTRVLAFSSTVGVAASTLAAAALFNPLRVRVQRAVDRRFNRSRYDAEGTVAAFAGRLRDAVDLETVQQDLIDTVHAAVQPEHATVWLRESQSR